jgi:hypothetical protein
MLEILPDVILGRERKAFIACETAFPRNCGFQNAV